MRAVVFLLVSWCALASGVVAQETLDARALDRALARGPYAGEAQVFYADRGARPFWTSPSDTSPSALSDRGRQLTAAFRGAGADGLDPEAYLSPWPASPEAREAALTAAFLRFCEHLMRGRVDPESVHRDWRAQRRVMDAGAALRLAARSGPVAAVRAARPPHPGYAHLRRALAAMASASGVPWEPLAPGPVLREGDDGPRVAELRQRLEDLGDLASRPSSRHQFDAEVDAAVRNAQTRFGLAVDGAVGPDTRAALNVTPESRARQIALNLERWRWLPSALGPRHVWVDAAGMTAMLMDGGAATWRGRAIMGTLGTPSPGFTSEITHAVLSPYWNIPTSIARAEIWPRVRRDPGYLARHHMERVPGGGLRQRPGPDNPLGPVKFIFETPFGVRIHGTSSPALFEQRVRTFSHGCIRIERPLELAERLLAGWDATRIADTVAEGRERWVELGAPVPIHVTYWTARADADARLSFSPDVYGRDLALSQALDSL